MYAVIYGYYFEYDLFAFKLISYPKNSIVFAFDTDFCFLFIIQDWLPYVNTGIVIVSWDLLVSASCLILLCSDLVIDLHICYETLSKLLNIVFKHQLKL